ncbi:MAG TPA: hypothetical protein IAA57_01855 [Candidatus Pullilachnospira intestinigallinarum]|nr:hypothetical protein [Candidatus Pullilachnospira intestinigallinarum]
MNWYKKLYLGDNVKKKEKKIIRRVERGKPVGNIYLITLALNPDNLLDIFRANLLLRKPLAGMCPMIVGIAEGYQEAVELVRRLVEETWNSRQDTDVRGYLQSRLEEAAGQTGE